MLQYSVESAKHLQLIHHLNTCPFICESNTIWTYLFSPDVCENDMKSCFILRALVLFNVQAVLPFHQLNTFINILEMSTLVNTQLYVYT